jgi:predicted metalloprotease
MRSQVICSLYQTRTIARQNPRRSKTAGHVARNEKCTQRFRRETIKEVRYGEVDRINLA